MVKTGTRPCSHARHDPGGGEAARREELPAGMHETVERIGELAGMPDDEPMEEDAGNARAPARTAGA